MRRGALALAAGAIAVAVAGTHVGNAMQSDLSAERRWDRAVDAWETGNYPAALDDLAALLASPAADDYLERAALLTGELYFALELATDGRAPKISSAGDLVSYETGPAAEPLTRVVRLGRRAATTIAELRGAQAAFNANGTALAYIRRPSSPGDRAALAVRTLANTTERVLDIGDLTPASPVFVSADRVLFIGSRPGDASVRDLFLAGGEGGPVAITNDGGAKAGLVTDPAGRVAMYSATATRFVVVDLATRSSRLINAFAAVLGPDGQQVAWVSRDQDRYSLSLTSVADGTTTLVRQGSERLDAPAFSPDGMRLAYQIMVDLSWEIMLRDRDGRERRLTRDVQHDVLPRFLTNDTLIEMVGESRHRRAYSYHLHTGVRHRLFANNTIRTISPEYLWLPSASGTRLVIQADRDGDTISAERGLYVVYLDDRHSVAEIRTRVAAQKRDETDLRDRMTRAFQPIAATVADTVSHILPHRIHAHLKTLVDFDSKHITRPGNLAALEYLERTYRSFGYPVELQWFTPDVPNAFRTANVIATKKGTTHPDVVYLISSHFDSVAAGPGADDNTSGTAALLEVARVLAHVPLPATVIFASFTAEESGLLGSREFVRRSEAAGWRAAGAINNDTIGWSADNGRPDNTIRYASPFVRDVQHGAAFLFTQLVTYDTRYYRNTDAHSLVDAWGEVVGGFGSYPILGSPHYHMPTDQLGTVDVHQIVETAKATTAATMFLASHPPDMPPARPATAAVLREGR